MRFFIFLLLFFIILFIITPITVGAETIDIPNPLGDKGIAEIIDVITDLLRVLAIGVGLIMVIWSGITIMTAGGSEEKVTKGKKMLTWTIIGVAIVISVDFIVGFIVELLS